MTKHEMFCYFIDTKEFRERMAERSFPGSSKELKNEAYAEALDVVAGYVQNLPDGDPLFDQVADLFDPHSAAGDDLWSFTIHCSVGIPSDVPEWLDQWVARMKDAASEEWFLDVD